MSTQKKSVRLSDESLDVLTRNGSDLDTAISRRLNAVIQRYGMLMKEVRAVVQNDEDEIELFVDAITLCQMRDQLGLPPIRLDTDRTVKEDHSPFLLDLLEAAQGEKQPINRENLEWAATKLSNKFAALPPEDIIGYTEEAERIARLLGDGGIEHSSYGIYYLWSNDTDMLVDLSLDFASTERDENVSLLLGGYVEDGSHEECLTLSVYPKRHLDPMWEPKAFIPLCSPAVEVSKKALLDLAVDILPYANDGMAELKDRQRGESMTAIMSLIDEAKPRIATAATPISTKEHFDDHPDKLDQIITQIIQVSKEHEQAISPMIIQGQIYGYMNTVTKYFVVEPEIYEIINTRLSSKGMLITPHAVRHPD